MGNNFDKEITDVELKKIQQFSDFLNKNFYLNFSSSEIHLALNSLISSLVHVAALTENPVEILYEAAEHLKEATENGFLEEQIKYIENEVKE